MRFTRRESRILKTTLAGVTARPQEAAAVFYDELFRRAPGARNLFVLDMARQGDKLMSTLSAVILRIDDWPDLVGQIEELGLRHTAYGVQPEHYPPTGDALLAMFRTMLGDDFDDEAAATWRKAYAGIAEIMITAADRRMGRAVAT